MISFRNILGWSHCSQGLSLITKISLKNCVKVEVWTLRSVGEASVFLGALERHQGIRCNEGESTSSRNLSKSLSFTQFAADSVEHLPSKRGQGEGSQGWQCDRTNARLMCAQLSCPQTWQDTKLYSSSHIMPMPLCKQKKNNFVDVLPFLKNPREALVYMKFLQSKR